MHEAHDSDTIVSFYCETLNEYHCCLGTEISKTVKLVIIAI